MLLLFYSIEYYDFNYCVLTMCFITRHVNHSFACSVFLDSSRHSSFYFPNITHLSVHRLHQPIARLHIFIFIQGPDYTIWAWHFVTFNANIVQNFPMEIVKMQKKKLTSGLFFLLFLFLTIITYLINMFTPNLSFTRLLINDNFLSK